MTKWEIGPKVIHFFCARFLRLRYDQSLYRKKIFFLIDIVFVTNVFNILLNKKFQKKGHQNLCKIFYSCAVNYLKFNYISKMVKNHVV